MKWTLILVLVVAVVVVTEAKSHYKHGERTGERNEACKYDYRAATCDQSTNKMVATLIADQSTDPNCAPTRTLRRNCNDKRHNGEGNGERNGERNKACRYDYRAATCDQSTNKMVATLIAEQSTDPNCAPTRTLRRNCNDKRHNGEGNGERNGERNKACRYDYRAATCDQSTNKMVATLIAEQSTDPNCAPTRTLRRNCNDKPHNGEGNGERNGERNKACRYDYRAATCDQSTNKMVATLIAEQSTDPNCAPTRTLRRNCNDKPHNGERNGERNKACKYDYRMATCDQSTSKMVATLIAEQSTGPNCAPTRTLRRNCNDKTNKGGHRGRD